MTDDHYEHLGLDFTGPKTNLQSASIIPSEIRSQSLQVLSEDQYIFHKSQVSNPAVC